MEKISPLLRGIYYLYLTGKTDKYFVWLERDHEAFMALAKLWHLSDDRKNWTTPKNCLFTDRKIFVSKLKGLW